MFSQEFKDRDTSYVLTAVMIHNEIFANSRNATIKNARIAAAKRATDKLERIGLDAFYEICNCESIIGRERVEIEETKEKHKEYRKLKKKGFTQDAIGNGDNEDDDVTQLGKAVEDQAAIVRRRMDEIFIDLDLDAKKGSTETTPQLKTNSPTESTNKPLHKNEEGSPGLSTQTNEAEDDEGSLMSFD